MPLPPLHGYSVTLSVKAGDVHLPPQGVFDWHYIQCVITRFGTRSYKGFLDINFFVYPFKTASDDSDEEYMDNDDVDRILPITLTDIWKNKGEDRWH